MRKLRKRGLAPGSVVFTGNQRVEKTAIHFLRFKPSSFEESELEGRPESGFADTNWDGVEWFDIRGIHDTKLIEDLGQDFQIHPLILEDVADTNQRPRFDEFADGHFIVLRALSFSTDLKEIETEQVAIYFKKGFLITFQEKGTDLFGPVRKRIRAGKGRILQRESDYLAYALVDTLVDDYYNVLDQMEEVIEKLEAGMMRDTTMDSKTEIHRLKKELVIVRKSISPLREAIAMFSKSESPLIHESSQIFIRDLYGQTVQIMDMVESYRDTLNSMQDLFITEVSFKMNQVIQVLTLVSTIFIPLSFLAGLYGMNFDVMPELHAQNGYYYLLGVMGIVAIGLLYFFKRRKWL